MLIATINGYSVHLPESGGKAGRGHNLTSSLQVFRDGTAGSRSIAKQFRFTLHDQNSRTKAIRACKAWINSQP